MKKTFKSITRNRFARNTYNNNFMINETYYIIIFL
jgi:hypothetical protein